MQIKMRNAELHLKRATVIYGLQPLVARYPEQVSKLERLNYSHYPDYKREYQSKLSTDHYPGER